jgi:ATP-dependent Clp protease ATP-binding subunit ClpC
MGVQVELSQSALEFVAERGFDKQYGARPLRRAMQKYIEDPIAEEILKGSVKAGSIVKVDVAANGTELLFQIETLGEESKTITTHPTTIEDVMKEAGISHSEELKDDESDLDKETSQ